MEIDQKGHQYSYYVETSKFKIKEGLFDVFMKRSITARQKLPLTPETRIVEYLKEK